jgi:hypothetical protein
MAQDEPATTTLSLASLKKALTEALVELRFEHPECACAAVWDEQGPLLQYTPAESAEEAYFWVEAVIELWFTAQSGLGVRKEIGRRRKEHGIFRRPRKVPYSTPYRGCSSGKGSTRSWCNGRCSIAYESYVLGWHQCEDVRREFAAETRGEARRQSRTRAI